jgi:hypothetical protein
VQDQAPLQNRAPDWQLGSNGCYDAATLANLQKTLAENLEAVADGNAEGCLSLPLPDATMQLLKQVGVVLSASLHRCGTLEKRVLNFQLRRLHMCRMSVSSMHAQCTFALWLFCPLLPGRSVISRSCTCIHHNNTVS